MQVHNIVLLGANQGGIPMAHYLLKHTIPHLEALTSTAKFHLTIVSPNTHFYWKIAGPRALISSKALPRDAYTWPVSRLMQKHRSDLWTHVQAWADSVHGPSRTVNIQLHEGDEKTLRYDSLIIATGSHYASPLWSTEYGSEATFFIQSQMNLELPRARSVIIAGGGPVGVETAGEIASNYPHARISLYSGGQRLLRCAKPSVAAKAEEALLSMGVSVFHHIRVAGPEPTSEGSTLVTFEDGSESRTDVYIDAANGGPNTNFLPVSWLESGRLRTDRSTLRVEGPNAERVYGLGDVTSHSNGQESYAVNGVKPLANALLFDIAKDLGLQLPPRAKRVPLKTIQDTMLFPIGKGGTGQILGLKIPGWLVYRLKGKDYSVQRAEALASGAIVEKL